jgi:2-oxoglutarate dehydrogenase E2 component (dihydrolipoamide succinyltransferase)
MATETAIDVVMPQMGVSVSEGTVTRWLKQEGEHVEADEPLLEISTDKVDTEVPSPGTGTLTQILVQEGQTVDVGTKLGQIGGPAGGGVAAPPLEAPEVEAPPQPQPAAAAPPPAPPAEQQAVGGNGRFVSPVVARIASEHNVDPSRVSGSGRGGRVTKKDIMDYIESGAAAAPPTPAPPTPAPPTAAPPTPAPPAPERVEVPAPPAPPQAAPVAPPPAPAAPAPAPPAPAPPAPPPQAAPAPAGVMPGETVEPVTAMRRGIAEHMRRSLDTAAHVTSAIEVDMSKVVAAREQLKQDYVASYGVNPTYLAFVARATVDTLRLHPYVNAELRGDSIVTRNFVNLGIAVELEDAKGLIVPVIRNAETMNLLGLAKGIADIAAKARDKKLVPDDVQGGTFTITNPGGYGTFHGTPVISQPQSAILGTYALVKRPWVIQDELGNDVIAIRPLMNITLTYDHRLVDGAYAGRFLRDLRARLEAWEGDGG